MLNFTELEGLQRELWALRQEMHLALERVDMSGIHPNFHFGAQNLVCYLALRRHDLRSLQSRLAGFGLSSLGRTEAHVMASIEAVLEVLQTLTRSPEVLATSQAFEGGENLLREHTLSLLGPSSPGRDVRIMVTMPSQAATDYTLVDDLLRQGMNCMRINCAHDQPSDWAAMIEHLRRAEASLGKSCKVAMDLAGPKVRTGPMEPGPQVLRIRPTRDDLGRVLAPARIWLYEAETNSPAPTSADACLPLRKRWLKLLRPGMAIRLSDARGSRRTLRVVDVGPTGCWAEACKTLYLVPGCQLVCGEGRGTQKKTRLGPLPALENAIRLQIGDTLWLTRDGQPGRPAVFDSSGRLLSPARIGCTLPEALKYVEPGEAIWFDDGKIGGLVEKVEASHLVVRITRTRARGGELKGDRGINLPDSHMELDALTQKDLQDLDFVAQHADILELSFANRVEDVQQLHRELLQRTPTPPPIVLKIETRRGFENLPAMLLEAMRGSCCGVMIARGDLVVECGFERLAEVQEEMLWICEAAHVPVIWATQVLENLAKEGLPSRAEISDAAMAHRAECVTLNKGPHILQAVATLDDILCRMQAHQIKKRSMLRELKLAHAMRAV